MKCAVADTSEIICHIPNKCYSLVKLLSFHQSYVSFPKFHVGNQKVCLECTYPYMDNFKIGIFVIT